MKESTEIDNPEFNMFQQLKVFFANSHVNSNNRLREIFDSKTYPNFYQEQVQTEWNKVTVGDIVILKFMEVSGLLNIDAIGRVKGKDEKKLEMDWVRLEERIKVSSDEFYKLPFAEIHPEYKKGVFEQLKSNSSFVRAIEKFHKKKIPYHFSPFLRSFSSPYRCCKGR